MNSSKYDRIFYILVVFQVWHDLSSENLHFKLKFIRKCGQFTYTEWKKIQAHIYFLFSFQKRFKVILQSVPHNGLLHQNGRNTATRCIAIISPRRIMTKCHDIWEAVIVVIVHLLMQVQKSTWRTCISRDWIHKHNITISAFQTRYVSPHYPGNSFVTSALQNDLPLNKKSFDQ